MKGRAPKKQHALAGHQSGGGNGTNSINLHPHYSSFPLDLQQLSSLLDLAQFEADQAREQYLSAEALADARRRRYFKAIDNLRAIQRSIIPTEGQQQ